MVSRKPLPWLPTVMNVAGTPVAMPMVYWRSKFCNSACCDLNVGIVFPDETPYNVPNTLSTCKIPKMSCEFDNAPRE